MLELLERKYTYTTNKQREEKQDEMKKKTLIKQI